MIRTHCDQPLVYSTENQYMFSRRCRVCGRRFTQRKRQKGN
jgi:hypothetical protein